MTNNVTYTHKLQKTTPTTTSRTVKRQLQNNSTSIRGIDVCDMHRLQSQGEGVWVGMRGYNHR